MSPTRLIPKLSEIVGPTHLSTVPSDRAAYGALDPSVVVWPAAAPEVARLLDTCRALGAAVAVAGAGIRGRGNWEDSGKRARIAVDTLRMNNVLDIDETSLTVHVQCGIRFNRLEQALASHRLTLGPYAAELGESTLGGLLAAPPPIAHSPKTGWLLDNCIGASIATLDGAVIHSRIAPRRSTGPDLMRLHLGSRGTLGLITAAVLRVCRRPERVLAKLLLFADVESALQFAGRFLAAGARPAQLQIFNEQQARFELGQPTPYPMPATCLVSLSGADALVAAEHELLAELVADLDGSELPQRLADSWIKRNRSIGDQRPGDGSTAQTTTTPEPDGPLAGVPLRYSQLGETLPALRQRLGDAIRLRVDQLSVHGGQLWIWSTTEENAPGETELRAALEALGLEPLGDRPWPLLDEVRRLMDPERTLLRRIDAG